MKKLYQAFELIIAVLVGVTGGSFIYNIVPTLIHGVTPENKLVILVGFFALFLFIYLLIQINHLKKKIK